MHTKTILKCKTFSGIGVYKMCNLNPPHSGGVARALRCSQFHGEGSASASGGEQAEQQGKRQHREQAEESPAPPGGGCTERLQRGGRKGGTHEERAQDAAGCELLLCLNINGVSEFAHKQ